MNLVERLRRMRRVFELARERLAVRRRNRSRHVYLGGQGDDNLGDEAMLEAARRLLPDSDIVSFAYAGQERQLAALGLSGPRYFDSAILGGGTLINPHWVEATRTAQGLGLQAWSLGTGVGSSGFGHPQTVKIDDWKTLLNQFEMIGVRGPLSKTRLEELGVETKVEVVGDLAMGLTAGSAAQPSETPRFALNVSMPETGCDERELKTALEEVEATARELMSRGWELVPVAMHRSDVAPLESIVERLTGRAAEVQPKKSIEAFDDSVGPCRFLIGVRLHSAVLASCIGVPSILLGYRDKCLDFAQAMEMPELYIDIGSFCSGVVKQKVDLVEQAHGELRNTVHKNAVGWKSYLERYVDRRMEMHRAG